MGIKTDDAKDLKNCENTWISEKLVFLSRTVYRVPAHMQVALEYKPQQIHIVRNILDKTTIANEVVVERSMKQ